MNAPSALALVFAAGLSGGAGPCWGTRFAASVACAATDPKHARRIVAVFLGGSICAYAGLGYAIGSMARFVQLSSWTYAFLALAFTLAGTAGLIRARGPACEGHKGEARGATSPGAIFLLGASSALTLSPCCTPLVAAIGTWAAASGAPERATLLLAVYGLGHGLPPALLALGLRSFALRLRPLALGQAASIVGNAILLALGGYYWCLA